MLAGRGLFSGREWEASLDIGIATGLEVVLGDREVVGTSETRALSCTVEWTLAARISIHDRFDVEECEDCLARGK